VRGAGTIAAAARLALSVFSSLAVSPEALKTMLFASRKLRIIPPRIAN
jgi:hypothetical protein